MRGTWLSRVGALFVIGGFLFLLLSGVGLVTGEWVWSLFLLGIAMLIVAQVLIALSYILLQVNLLHERIGNLEKQLNRNPGKPADHAA